MNAEDHIQKLKKIPPLTKEEKRKQLTTAIVLALATLLSVIFLLYAFIQKLEADKQTALAIEMRMEAEKQREEAERQRLMAEYQKMEAEKQRVLALEALANCEKSKRK